MEIDDHGDQNGQDNANHDRKVEGLATVHDNISE